MAVRQEKLDEMISHLAMYDFRQLHTWYAEARAKILSQDGVTFGDIDEIQNRIVIGVMDSDAMARVQAALTTLAAPDDAVLVKSGVRPARLDRATSLRGIVRPVVAGVQINRGVGEPGACTLGYNVAHPQDSYWYFTTAAHCTGAGIGNVSGDTFGQPDINSPIAFDVADPPVFTPAQDSRCPSHTCRYSDVALLRYTTGNWKHGHVAWPNTGSINFTTTRGINAAADPTMYMLVHMVGRTSGHTGGLVIGVCVDRFVADGVWRLCSGMADYVSDPGDSGAPVVTDVLNIVTARGSHWGSDLGPEPTNKYFSMHSQWDSEMRQDFGGSFDVTLAGSPAPFVNISGHNLIPPDLACTWTASATGGVPPYSFVWSGVLSGGGGSIEGILFSSGTLNVKVTDAVGHTDTDSFFITVQDGAPAPPDCFE